MLPDTSSLVAGTTPGKGPFYLAGGTFGLHCQSTVTGVLGTFSPAAEGLRALSDQAGQEDDGLRTQ